MADTLLIMADSKLADSKHGLMIAGMAYRVKYRIDFGNEQGCRLRVRPAELGVHKKNRGGVYPGGARCSELLVGCRTNGIMQDEVDHGTSVVEEPPASEIIKMPQYQSTLDYNIEQCANDELLRTCYAEPYNFVSKGMLAHNHFMTVCRAVISKALWKLPAVPDNHITFCTDDGRLSLSAVAATTNGEQLKAIINDGIVCEVLSWKMDVEEPDAASLISQAMNESTAVAMRTTELSAIAVLKCEIIIQMNKDVSQRVFI